MKPQEIYDQIESAWKDAAVHTMVLREIHEGRRKANPDAFTIEQQLKAWDMASRKIRSALDALADLKSEAPIVEAKADPGPYHFNGPCPNCGVICDCMDRTNPHKPGCKWAAQGKEGAA